MMKKAIALLITIATILLLTIIILKHLSIQEKIYSQKNSIKNLIQRELLVKDIQKNFSKITEKINTEKELEKLFTTFTISKKNINLIVTITPLSNKLNINYIFQNKKTIATYKPIMEENLVKENVLDIEFFYDLIIDTIDKDTKRKTNYESEIIDYNKLFTNGAIYSSKHFEEIIKYYISVNGDENIVKAVKEMFFFSDKKYNKLYSSMSNVLNTNLLSTNNNKFKKGQEFLVEIEASYTTNKIEDKFYIIFNLANSEIINISQTKSWF